ncbi:hypothetical protein OESDEN_13726 [Oesophagostomum dentatum]|uniref:7TM GPCR serpentine receptor class x (Srx) domain-containing protein n=1 Tax=Oesophagostomum dentatum TaxID=61180 RepID=A0A0B1SMG0_OESDE|nr:hypothetical protein OESDEN_13726 [Oesophagostomum dentatum]
MLLFSAACCAGGVVISVCVQVLSPCCSGNLSHIIDFVFDASVSAYSGISYIALFIYVVRKGTSGIGKRELTCFIQFVLMFLVYAATWVAFFIVNALASKTRASYIATPALEMLNCGANATLYLVMNKEVRRAARDLLKRNSVIAPLQTHPQTVPSDRANMKNSTVTSGNTSVTEKKKTVQS